VIAAANNVVSCFNVVSGAVLEGCGEVRGNTVQSGYRLIESLNKWQQEHPGAVGIQGIAGAIGLDMGKNLVTEGVTATSFGSPETKMQTGLNTLEQTGNLDAALKAVGLSTFSPLTLSFNTDTPQVKQRAEETAALAGILPKNYAELLKTGQMTQDQIDQRMNPSTWTPTQKQAFFAFLPHEDPNPLKWASKNLFNAEISINPFIHQGSSQLICQSSYGSICNSGYQQLSTMSNQDYQQANRVLGEILPGYQPSDYESLNSYINAKNSCMASGGGAANYEFCTANAASVTFFQSSNVPFFARF
jgi:hypothetical protein